MNGYGVRRRASLAAALHDFVFDFQLDLCRSALDSDSPNVGSYIVRGDNG